MANLQFNRKKSPLRKALPWIIAVLAAVGAIALVVAWGIVRYHQDQVKNPTSVDSSDPESEQSDLYTRDDVENRLILFDEAGHERFVLVQTDPEEVCLRVRSIPGNLKTGDKETVTGLLRKYGAARATKAVSDAIGLPIPHYISFTGNAAESFLHHLENGVKLPLPEPVDFSDPNGTRILLDAGDAVLTAVQSVGLLRYDNWTKTDPAEYAALLVSAVLNQYVKDDRYFDEDFAILSNVAKTDLRIGDYTDRKPVLQFLADRNNGSLCQTGAYPVIPAPDGTCQADQNTARRKDRLYR